MYLLKFSIYLDLAGGPDQCRFLLKSAGSVPSNRTPLLFLGKMYSRENAIKSGTRVFPGSNSKEHCVFPR